jgi:hypothetical protein
VATRAGCLLATLALALAAGCGSSSPPCAFTLIENQVSAQIPTVGIVAWALAGEPPDSATIVYRLKHGPASLLNQGGEAPVALANADHRTLLLGLKQGRDYTFHIQATRQGATCASPEYALPTTGSLSGAPKVTVSVAQPEKRAPGFIVTSSGTFVPDAAFIIDADGEIVWTFPGPASTTRAHMDYEGRNMWMIALNVLNEGGEMRSVSMDGQQLSMNVAGLDTAHHDFTVMPGGKVAALAWGAPGVDPVGNLLVRSPDGQVTTAFQIDGRLYASDSFHPNAVHYIPADDSFTIADRNPNVVVKVSSAGVPAWQLGGSCAGAPAGAHCSPQAWQVDHGHHLLPDGTLLLFNNTYTDTPHVLQYSLNDTPAALVHDYAGTAATMTLGDVQRLPNGNTLVTYSEAGQIVELDPSWNVVQTFAVRTGYTTWRPTLYGPPPRL